MREKDEPTDEQVRTATDPTLMEGDTQMPTAPGKSPPIDIPGGCATIRMTGWSCAWEGSSRQFIAAHPKMSWLRVTGRSADLVVQRIAQVQKWSKGAKS